jgi:soluble lytic murein transglycosylase-like protein
MDIVTTILSAAKSVGVSGTLLLAICDHESGGFKHNYTLRDHGTPSYGVCQVKRNTASMFGFKGDPKKLIDPKINAKYAAKYLKYQEDRYGSSWVRMAASYNSGSYNPSKKVLGCPRNLKYIKEVQKKLPEEFRNKLNCGNRRH